MLSPAHRRFLIKELMSGIETIGPEYEAFGTRFVDCIADETMQHRGLNPEGHPVGHTVDSVSETGDVAAEYSAESDYFKPPFSKIRNDVRHSREEHPQANRVLLLSSRECGPKAHTRLVNLRARVKRWMNINLEIYDCRRQAEIIVDELLLDDRAVDSLSPYVAPLEKVRAESAATNLVPRLSPSYIGRTETETSLLQLLRAERVAVLAGMSGTGKSETSVAVANELINEFEMVVWVPASTIVEVNNLQAFQVERREHRVNLLHLLRERSCLVILDDLRLGLSTADLKQYCGKDSAILVTRQSAVPGDISMPFLARGDARVLLEQDLSIACPNDVFELVWGTVGGHPLALRLMNAGVRNGSWDELPADCAAIGEYPDPERLQRLADRLLGRLETLLQRELAFILWCRSSRVDRSFARRVLAPRGLRKLDEACLLAADRNDVLRLHEIVYNATRGLQIPIQHYAAEEFEPQLDAHIVELAYGTDTALGFLTFCQVHAAQLERLLRSQTNRSTCLYCLAHTWSDEAVDLSLVGDPLSRAKELAAAGSPNNIEVSAVCEAAEAIYRKVKHDSGIEAARTKLGGFLGVFTSLADTPGISDYGQRTARHHQAKALRNLQRYDEAIAICESILEKHDSPATKLLLARLLVFNKDRKVIERAKNLLFELLEEANTSPATAEISVTLAAIETLGRRQLKEWFRNALQQFGSLVASFIVESAARGLDQAFVAFASIGRDLAYNDEALFISIFKELPRQSPDDARDDKERAAWGHILLAASEAASLNQPERLATEALGFYQVIQKPAPFDQQQHGRALVLLNRFPEAVQILQPGVAAAPNPWNRYWLSKAFFGMNQGAEALRLIDEALADPKCVGYEAPFLEHRWQIRNASGDPNALDDLQKAHDCCRDAKHLDSLAAKLASERGKRTS